MHGSVPSFVNRVLRRLILEPLTQFLLLGGLIILSVQIYRWNEQPAVIIDRAEIEQMEAYWRAQSQAEPTESELRAMIDERINEEVLAQEAQNLGLHRNDIIIRRRLAQKMAFANEDTAQIPEPSDQVLRAFFDQTKAQYIEPALISFRHQFFARSGDGALALKRAQSALERIKTSSIDAPGAGDPFILPLTYRDIDLFQLERDYGLDFSKALESLPLNQWAGPVGSAYGYHLVFIQDRKITGEPRFELLRDQVREAYMAQKRQENNRLFLQQLRAKYRIVIDENALPAGKSPPQE